MRILCFQTELLEQEKNSTHETKEKTIKEYVEVEAQTRKKRNQQITDLNQRYEGIMFLPCVFSIVDNLHLLFAPDVLQTFE